MAYVVDGERPQGATHPKLGKDKSAEGNMLDGVLLGEDVNFGDLLYQGTDGKYYKALAGNDMMMPCKAISVWTEKAENPSVILKNGFVRLDAMGLNPRQNLYLSNSVPGRFVTVPPADYRQQIGETIGPSPSVMWFNPEPNINYGFDNRRILKDHDIDIRKLYQKQIILYRCYIWETDISPKVIIRGDKHVRLKVIDAAVTVADNSGNDQIIFIGTDGNNGNEITDVLSIAKTYYAGVSIPLRIKRNYIGVNEQISVWFYTQKRVIVDLLCEADE